MADPFDLFGAVDTPEGRAQALASALRRKQAAGTLGMLSGDKVLGAYGQQALRGSDEMDIQRAELQRQAQENQAARTKAYEESVRQNAELRKSQQAQQASQFDTNTETRRLAATMKARAAAAKAEAAKNAPPTVTERRQTMRESALAPRAGWEKVDEAGSVFRTPAQAVFFDNSVAALDALKNHRHHAGEAMEKFRNAKTVQEKDAALALINQQMANIASKLRVAEGLNSSDASNHAVDTMLSLSNGSVANFRNFANEGRLDAILNSAIGSAETNLDTLASSNNLRRKGGKGGHGKPTGPRIIRLPSGEEVEVDE